MGLIKGNITLATDFNAVRTRVIAEFNTTNRRNIGSNYKTPAGTQSAGNTMNAANVNNIAASLYYVNSNTYSTSAISAGIQTKAQINGIVTALTTFESCPKQGSNSGCKSGCIGLCQGCSGGCSSGCSGGCDSGCSNECTAACSFGCVGICGGCSSLCQTSCEAICRDGILV